MADVGETKGRWPLQRPEEDLREDVLTTAQLAARLQWSTKTVSRMPLPHLSTGRRGKRYYWPDVLEHLRRTSRLKRENTK